MVRLDWLKKKLEREFEKSVLEEFDYSLDEGFTINRKSKTITFGQRKYIEEELKWFNTRDYKPIATSLETNLKLIKLIKLINEECIEVEHEMQGNIYKAAVGSLIHAMVGTRICAFLVSIISKNIKK